MTRTTKAPTAHEVARTFSELLLHYIGADKLSKVVALNAQEDDPHACHTHDFCDANEIMIQTFEKYHMDWRHYDDLLNAAWNIAKAQKFFLNVTPYVLRYNGVASTPDYLIKEEKTGEVVCRFPPTTTKTADKIRKNADKVLLALNSHDKLVDAATIALRELRNFYADQECDAIRVLKDVIESTTKK